MKLEYKKLINRLIEKTQAGEISWIPTSKENSYLINIGNNSVVVEKIEKEPYSLTKALDGCILKIYKEGKIVDELTKYDNPLGSTDIFEDYELLYTLYELAR